MAAKSFMRVVLAMVVGLFVWSATPVLAKGGDCAAVKSKTECSKNAHCKWTGKSCSAKTAAKAAKKETKAAKKAAAKPAAKAPHKAKPVESAAPAAEESAPAAEDNVPTDDEPAEEAPVEGEEDF